MENGFLNGPETLAKAVEAGVKKAGNSAVRLVVLGLLAGIYIAFASEGSNMAAFNLLANPDTYGLGKALAGAVFGTGLMLVIIAGGELFTGNNLMLAALVEKKINPGRMLRNWGIVYAANFAGALLIAFMMNRSMLFNSGANLLGGMTVKIAAYKVGLSFESAFWLGVMCNILVCAAVWMSYACKDVTAKVLVIFFVIMLFITSGFEHSIANMYYIPAGIMAKSNSAWLAASGLGGEALAELNWVNYAVKNLLPVTLGNIAGGGVVVGLGYWIAYADRKRVKFEKIQGNR